MLEERAHEREDIGIVRGGRDDELAVTERILHCLRHILAREIGDGYLRASLCFQLVCQKLDRFLCVAVNGRIGDEHAFGLDAVTRPGLIKVQVVTEIFLENRTVQRADRLNVKVCRFLKNCLYLCAVFADDPEIVSPRFACPVLLNVQSAELSETVRGEQNLIPGIIGHEDLWPVYHGRRDEVERMRAEFQRVAFADDDAAVRKVRAEEILHHRKCLRRRNDLRVRILACKRHDVCRMVRFHMLDDQIIGLASGQRVFEIVKPFMFETGVDGIEHGDLPIHHDIGIVCHAVRYDILSLEQVDRMVVDADIKNGIGYMIQVHKILPVHFSPS